MRSFRLFDALVFALLTLAAVLAAAQTTPITGIPPLSSTAASAFDTVNLANLNAHFAIPVFSRPGKGISFSYALSYDTLVWQVITNSQGKLQWAPMPNWGWHASTESSIGYVTYTYADTVVVCSGNNVEKEIWSNFVYHDPMGVPHRFFGNVYLYDDNGCGSSRPSLSAVAFDGSGYQIQLGPVQTGELNVPTTVTGAGGIKISPPSQSNSGGGALQDANGNVITAASSGGATITDTLGTTALTISGIAPSNPPTCGPTVTYTYTAPSGGPAAVTVSYTSYTVQTNFGVSGILEYGASSACLVSSVRLPDGSQYQFNYEATTGASGKTTGRLASVTLPTGGVVTYSYGSSNSMMSDGSPSYLQRSLGGGTWTYTRQLNPSGGGNTQYTQTKVMDPASTSNETDLNFNGIYETNRVVYAGSASSGVVLNHTWSGYNSCSSGCDTTLFSPPITAKHYYDGSNFSNGTYLWLDYTYNSSGLLTSEVDYDWGNHGPIIRAITINYNSSLCNSYSICDRPVSLQVTDGTSQKAYTTYSYDQGGNTLGSVTTVSRWTGGSAYLNQGYTYNTGGTVATATDPNGTVTTYSYAGTSCNGAFPTRVSAAALGTDYTYDCNGGVVKKVTDPNGQPTTTTYSDQYYWRPASISDPLSNVTNYSYYPTLSNVGQTRAVMNFINGNSTSDVVTTLDAWGRPSLQQKRQGPNSSTYDTVETDYDVSGRIAKATLPFATTLGQTSATAVSTTTAYDALGRPSTVTDGGNGTVTYTYNFNDVLVTVGPAPTGENTKKRQYEYDGLGRLSSVCEMTSGSTSGCGQNSNATSFAYRTTYTYNPLGNLLTVNQSGQTRSYSYDGLGRMTSETNPESGTRTYVYDSYPQGVCGGWTSQPGDLMLVTNADGSSSCFVHDALHRLTDEGDLGKGTFCRRFRYDNSSGLLGSRPSGISPTNSLGRLVEAVTDTCGWPPAQAYILADEWFSYDVRGQATDYWQSSTNSGGWYHVQQSYWENGSPNTLQAFTGTGTSAPISHSFTNTLEGEGRLYQTKDNTAGTYILASAGYNAASQSTQVNVIGSSEAFQYDGNTGRMSQWQSTAGTQNQTGVLTWNANGTLKQLVISDTYNQVHSQTCTYSYDDLSRLASNNCGSSVMNQNFSYDAWGNLQKSVPTGSTGFSYTPTYDVHNRASYSTYDSVGNTMTDGSITYSYDANGRPVSVNGTQVLYDAFGRMVEYGSSGAYYQVLYGPQGNRLAKMGGQTLWWYILPLAGGMQGVFTTSGLSNYRHVDWLGSTRLHVDSNGNPLGSRSFAPFGETYAETGSNTDRPFTGMRQELVNGPTGNYDFLFRELSAAQGRWLVPDPAGLAAVDITNPQTWNRYVYVANRPLASLDPLGLYIATAGHDDYWGVWGSLSNFVTQLLEGTGGGGGSATTPAAKRPGGGLPPCNNFTLDSADTFWDDEFATPEQVDDFVSAQAKAPAAWDGYNAAVAFSNAGLNPALALGIIGAETSFNPTAQGRTDPFSSGGTSFSSSLSRGLRTIVKIQNATYSNSTPLAALWDANNPLPVKKGVVGQQYVADGTGPTTWKAGVQTWFRRFARFIGKCK